MKIGLALGGGGVRSLAHIPILEVFDELGVRPHCISGTSMGAVIGALYAGGLDAAAIREWAVEMTGIAGGVAGKRRGLKAMLRWIEFKDIEFGAHGIFRGDRFMALLDKAIGVSTFEQLNIPLKVVATDFWDSRQVVFDSGDLLPAIRASMSLPGLLTPVRVHDRVYVDGAGVNPVPHDVLTGCDARVAVDVMGYLERGRQGRPHLVRSILGIIDIMQNTIIAEKLKADPPDIYIKPAIYNVDVLEFDKARHVLIQAESAKEPFRKKLEALCRGSLQP